ncbi:MAG: hypothetical protein L6Q71_11220 [Planctomycetes bacterium]|nr:hypothetical protein [Planctomycetota bacterium]NUQ35040.1 hypothetical protein [Planctomycetaceae bacterium]
MPKSLYLWLAVALIFGASSAQASLLTGRLFSFDDEQAEEPSNPPADPYLLPDWSLHPWYRISYRYIDSSGGDDFSSQSLRVGAGLAWAGNTGERKCHPRDKIRALTLTGLNEWGDIGDGEAKRIGLLVNYLDMYAGSGCPHNHGYRVGVGYIQSTNLTDAGLRQDGVRLEATGFLGLVAVEAHLGMALEFYNEDFLSEFDFSFTVPRPIFPIGLSLGVLHQDTDGFRREALYAGLEIAW